MRLQENKKQRNIIEHKRNRKFHKNLLRMGGTQSQLDMLKNPLALHDLYDKLKAFDTTKEDAEARRKAKGR